MKDDERLYRSNQQKTRYDYCTFPSNIISNNKNERRKEKYVKKFQKLAAGRVELELKREEMVFY